MRHPTFTGAALFVLLLSAACASAADEKKSPAATQLTNPLAVRIMNYGKFQDDAWTHLPSVGVHFLFMAVPQPERSGRPQEEAGRPRLGGLGSARRYRSWQGIER